MPLDTVLCLDTSGSMNGRGMAELKKGVRQFLLGVQETANKMNLRENVAVVEFGGGARVIQSLSGNYGTVMQSVDNLKARGTTPMFEGLMEAMREILQRGGVLTLPGGRKMTPRVILMTDGYPDDKENVLKAALSFGPAGWQAVGLPHPIPIACVGCGGDVDKDLLQAIAKLTNGMYILGDVSQLSEFFRRQVLLIRFAAQFGHDMQRLRDIMVLRQFMANMGESVDDAELAGLKTLLLAMLLMSADDDSDDEDDSEQSNMPPFGSRVRRGRDWKWGMQDRLGVGTVVKHRSDGQLVVEWDYDDSTTYRYRFGAEGARDVRVVDEVRAVGRAGVKVGCRVVRGRDWQARYGDQDGGRGSVGAVYRVQPRETFNVHVRWPNGTKANYRYHPPNTKEIELEEHVVVGTVTALAALRLVGAMGGDDDSPPSSPRSTKSRACSIM
ncbi:MIB1 [Branchiostoma lanceolatum]|uniref:MIB1 protein n=1 Tax=Branchiostoma lanceolatum TaxID=7740 RepID=A0A8K0A653_BRALA|nr:MIB1 [Branchiostoma lanceolatum]